MLEEIHRLQDVLEHDLNRSVLGPRRLITAARSALRLTDLYKAAGLEALLEGPLRLAATVRAVAEREREEGWYGGLADTVAGKEWRISSEQME